MAGFFSQLFGKKDVASEDARRIYTKLMTQARDPMFFGADKVPDNYDGRIDLLTLHIAVILKALSNFGQQGERLSQAIYDVMRDDFEIAMREEGLSDTGIKRRIKPMMQLFFTRVKTYVETLEADLDFLPVFSKGLLVEGDESFSAFMSSYTSDFAQSIASKSLGEIALADFSFPK